MSNDQTTAAGSGDEPNEEAGVARDILEALNAEDVVDSPGRPQPIEPHESLPGDADVPPPL